MKKLLQFTIIFSVLFLFKQTLSAQTSPVVQWEKTLGGSSSDHCYSVQQTPDGGYFIAGFSYSNISGDKTQANVGGNTITPDYWIIRLDAAGNKLWDRTIGGITGDCLKTLRVTPDGGFILGGYSGSPISGDKSQSPKGGASDFWVVKYDALANKQWDKTIGGNDDDLLYSLELTADGGYILGGESWSGISGDKSQINKGVADYWIVKLDASGNKVWDKTFGTTDTDILTSVKQTSDGGYILGGWSTAIAGSDKSQNGRGYADYWVIRLTATGTKIWDKTIGGNGSEQLSAILQTADGSFILGGWSTSNISVDKTQVSKGLDDFWVVKLDANGTIIWDKTIGGNSQDQMMDLQQTADGGFIAGGLSYSGIGGDKSQASRGLEDYWVVKMDQNGNKIWDKTLGASNHEQINTIKQTKDGGYVMGGTTYSGASADKASASKGGTDFWVIKLGPNCAELSATLAVVCGANASDVRVNISGMLPTIAGVPSWTLTYSVNNVTQTLQGSSAVADLALNVAPGTVFSLTSITSGSCTANLSNTITTEAIPGAPTVIPASRCNAGSVTLAAGGALSGSNYNWYANANSSTPLQTGISNTYNTPSLTNTTTYYVAIANAAGCESSRIPVTATVTNLNAVAGPAQAVCATAVPVQLTGFSPTGGTWSGAGVSVAGLFTPDNSLLGNQTLTYTVSQNGCTSAATRIITVTATPVVNAGLNDTLCANASPFQFTGYSPGGGTWSGNGVGTSGLFTPNSSMAGTQTLTYSIYSNGCQVSATKQVFIPAVLTQPVISLVAPDTLIASTPGKSYEWKFNNAIIPGNKQKIKVTASGMYTVRVKDSWNCASTVSAGYNYLISGLGKELYLPVSLFPNPVTDVLNLTIQQTGNLEFMLMNSLGQQVKAQTEVKMPGKVAMNVSHLPQGVYFLKIKNGEQVCIKKVIKN